MELTVKDGKSVAIREPESTTSARARQRELERVTEQTLIPDSER